LNSRLLLSLLFFVRIYDKICRMKKRDDPKKPEDAGEPTPPDPAEEIKPSDYLRAVKVHLRGGEQKDAFSLLLRASVQFPDEPLILSYYGCLQAIVDKKYRSGVEACKRALVLFKEKKSSGEEVLYPVFYLNLGRAYLAAGKKKDAIDAFHKGLQYDKSNSDLRKEIRRLGMRKKPPVPFLDRANPINKYIGLILQKVKKEPEKHSGKGTRGK
jgi:tetratricopeptide (TPR) repeat protein